MQKKINSKDIQNIENLKLSIQFSLDGFSFCIVDTLSEEIVHLSEHFLTKDSSTPEDLLVKIKEVFKNNANLQLNFSSVLAIHQNALSVLVPEKYFDKNKLKEYLKFNIKILPTDYLTFEDLKVIKAKNVYIPYVNINNFLFQNFGTFEYKHHLSILIEKLIAKNTTTQKRMFVNFARKSFDIIVLEGRKLLLSNTFLLTTKEEFIYYVLFVAEQLKLDREDFELLFLGEVEESSDFYAIAFQYIRNIDFLQNRYTFLKNSDYTKQTNYILLG